MIIVRHLISGPRLPFTAAYFGSIICTLYFALGVSSAVFREWLDNPANSLSNIASKYIADIGVCCCTTGLRSVVFDQLLPNGLNRPALGLEVRYQQSSCLDERMMQKA